MRVALALLVALAGCKKGRPPEPHAPVHVEVQAPPESETPNADKMVAEEIDDPNPAWLSGTWKQDGEPRWLLFNLPSEVAELAGKPPRVTRRGKLVVHGRFVSAIFPDQEIHFEATQDHAELAVTGAPGVYRRGAPP